MTTPSLAANQAAEVVGSHSELFYVVFSDALLTYSPDAIYGFAYPVGDPQYVCSGLRSTSTHEAPHNPPTCDFLAGIISPAGPGERHPREMRIYVLYSSKAIPAQVGNL